MKKMTLVLFTALLCLCARRCLADSHWWTSAEYVELSSQTQNVSTDSLSVIVDGNIRTAVTWYNASERAANEKEYNNSPTYCCAAYAHSFYEEVYGLKIDNLNNTSSVPGVVSGGGYFYAVSTPQIGDIIRVNTSIHWGIVKSVDSSGTVTVIQQNAGYFNTDGDYLAMVNAKIAAPYSSVTFFRWSEATTLVPASGASSTTSYVLDLNGCLDGTDTWWTTDYGTCDIYINDVCVASGVSDYYKAWPAGVRYEIKNIQPAIYKAYRGVSAGAQSGTIDQPMIGGGMSGEDIVGVWLSFETAFIPLDVNGYLDGADAYSIADYGTFDVYVDDVLDADDVSDYWKMLPVGTLYHIDDIKPETGSYYQGAHKGKTSGIINLASINGEGTPDYIGVWLTFDMPIKYYNFTAAASEGGTVYTGENGKHIEGSIISIAAYPNDGYHFTGWTSSNGGSFGNAFSASTTFTLPRGGAIVTAHFEGTPRTVTITDFTGGTVYADMSKTYHSGDAFFAGLTSVDPGYRFLGWIVNDDGSHQITETSTMLNIVIPESNVIITPCFAVIEGTATTEWQYGSFVPLNLNQSVLDIEYRNSYHMVATSSPGDEWTQGTVYNSYYQNSGAVQEFLTEQTASATFEYLGYYYFHYCGSSAGEFVNYEQTSKYTTYHETRCVDEYDRVQQFYDAGGGCYSYRLIWNGGQWQGGRALCTDQRSTIWYVKYMYQPKVLITEFNWNRLSAWVSQSDPEADSFEVRWRLKNGQPLSPDAITQIVAPDSLSIVAGETAHLEVDTVPTGVDRAALTYMITDPRLMEIDDGQNITAKYVKGVWSTDLTISAPNGVTKSVTLYLESNIIDFDLTINGRPENDSDAIDVYTTGQGVPYQLTYSLCNDYDPGYGISSDEESIIVDPETETITFTEPFNGVFSVYMDALNVHRGYGTILVLDGTKTFHVPTSLTEIANQAFQGTAAECFILPKHDIYIGDDAFPAGAYVLLDTSMMSNCDFAEDDVTFVDLSGIHNTEFEELHGNYLVQRQ